MKIIFTNLISTKKTILTKKRISHKGLTTPKDNPPQTMITPNTLPPSYRQN